MLLALVKRMHHRILYTLAERLGPRSKLMAVITRMAFYRYDRFARIPLNPFIYASFMQSPFRAKNDMILKILASKDTLQFITIKDSFLEDQYVPLVESTFHRFWRASNRDYELRQMIRFILKRKVSVKLSSSGYPLSCIAELFDVETSLLMRTIFLQSFLATSVVSSCATVVNPCRLFSLQMNF